MESNDGWTVITVRLPTRLVERLRSYARGEGRRPPATINAATAYLLELGLAEATGERPAPPRRGADGEGETT